MIVTRLKLPFGEMPDKFDADGKEQWRDYCAVTNVSSDKPDEIVIIDLVLTALSKADIIKVADISEATDKDMTDAGIEVGIKIGLPLFVAGLVANK